MELMVPQFIKPGETIRIEVATGKYVDRVRADSEEILESRRRRQKAETRKREAGIRKLKSEVRR